VVVVAAAAGEVRRLLGECNEQTGGGGRKEFEPSRNYLLKLISWIQVLHRYTNESPQKHSTFDNSV